MILAEWKRQFHVGQRLVCTYRWYWGKSADRPAPPDGCEMITVHHVKAAYLVYSTPDKPRVYLDFPKSHELKADEKGFELYFPSDPKWKERAGQLMSRYEWVAE